MNFPFAKNIALFLIAGIEKNYAQGISDVVKKAKKKFSDVKFGVKVDYSSVDTEAIRMFKREAFTVAQVGSYELEEKLKKLAVDIWQNYGQDLEEFEKQARNIMLQYIPINDQIPTGWLETNFNTAINSSYKAAEYNRLQQYKAIYPAYEYKTQGDDHVRPEHEDLDGLILKCDDPMWDTIYPPNDWNCRCWVDPIDSDEFDPAELTELTDEERLTQENKVAPDFQRNSGQDKSIWGKWLESKLSDMPEDVVKEIKSNVRELSKTL